MPPRPPLTSRNGEDHLILAAFEQETHGFYVDVGAFDGVYASKTWALEQIGWSGLCAEPSPPVFSLLTRSRPRALCIEVAVGARSGRATLYVDPTMNLSSLVSEESVRSAYHRVEEFRGLDSEEFSTIDVDVVTLDSLLRRARWRGPIDLLTVDVGGTENEVLDGLDMTTHEPRLIVFELGQDAPTNDLITRLEHLGYTHCRTIERSLFFASEPQIIRRLTRTEISCFIPRNLHPYGLTHTRLDQRNDRVVMRGRDVALHELITDHGDDTEGITAGSSAAKTAR